jgi:uncharacterized protein (DUF2336 family)
MTQEKLMGSVVNLSALPKQFPTHMQEGAFWESLGRAVATFGFLEEVLGRRSSRSPRHDPMTRPRFSKRTRSGCRS